ncbi:hypothetical protein BGZ60DRAFT_112692 [Tricladium varicosporioides]|nr:hypothetical protein BGZ60DRAFT_112692 [Hymenoscyphus varicosporioides]
MPDSQFRALRPHSKSKGGCKRCKARKVKCNEARPCESCHRRNETCEYPDPGPRKRASGSRSPLPSTISTQVTNTIASSTPPYAVSRENFPLSIESKERRLLELKLMHHFITSTVQKNFLSVHDEHVLDMWYSLAPALAIDHPVLLNIILSIAALHIFKVNPEELRMADIHRIYFNAAVSEHRNVIQDINPQNIEAVCLSTILIGLPAFMFLQNTEIGSYSPPLQLFHLMEGTIIVFQTALPMLSDRSKVRSVMNAKPNIVDFRDSPMEDYLKPFSKLTQWRASAEEIDAESQQAYNFMLGYIGAIHVKIEEGWDERQLRRVYYSLITLTPPKFVEQLHQRNPRALVILAYYFSLAKAMDDVWWMRGIAERETLGIQSILPEHWQWAMAWPLQKLAFYAASSVPSSKGADSKDAA